MNTRQNQKSGAPNTKAPAPPSTQQSEVLEAAAPVPLPLFDGVSQLNWFTQGNNYFAPGCGNLQYQTSGQGYAPSYTPDGMPIHLEYMPNANLARCFGVPSNLSGPAHNNLIGPVHNLIAGPVNNYNYCQQFTQSGCEFINPLHYLGGTPNPLGICTPGHSQGTEYSTPRSTYGEGIDTLPQGPVEGFDMSSAPTAIPRLRPLLPRALSPQETPSTIIAEHERMNVGNGKSESGGEGMPRNPESADRNTSSEAGNRRSKRPNRSHTRKSTVMK
ncbi:hypothetical protein GGR58DRAFT_522436 [Xylaria digitata]|nr:hypothetical protein GGR58DRAFT_522436 [Xylaria digitata]